MARFCACCTRERSSLQCLALLGVLAFVFSVLSVTSCRFFEIQVFEGSQQQGGLFALNYRHDTCINYNDLPRDVIDVTFDASTKAARAFGVMANILGGVNLLVIFAMQCFMPPKQAWRGMALSYVAAFVCQSLTFLIWKQIVDNDCSKDDVDCTMGFGSIISIVATILYLLIGVALLFLLPVPSDTAYHCPWLTGTVANCVACTGITRKKNIKNNLKSVGWIHFLIMTLCVAALCCSLAVVLGCRFYESSFEESKWQLGLFSYYYPPEESCRMYEYGSRQSFYSSTKAAQAFGVLAIVFAAILTWLTWTMSLLLNYVKLYYTVLPVIAFFGGLCQALTFLMFKEGNDRVCKYQDCSWGVDGILAVVGCVLFFVILMPMVFLFYKYSDEEEEEGDEKFAEEQEVAKEEPTRDEEPIDVQPEEQVAKPDTTAYVPGN